MLGHGTVGPEERVAALLRWYPEAWRARHGEGLGEVLRDTIADERDGVRVSLDVAREGLVERARAFDPSALRRGDHADRRLDHVLPAGRRSRRRVLVRPSPRSWFLALYFEGPERGS